MGSVLVFRGVCFSSSLEVNILYIYIYVCIEVVLCMLSPFPEMFFFYFLVQDPYKICKPSFATYWNSVSCFCFSVSKDSREPL